MSGTGHSSPTEPTDGGNDTSGRETYRSRRRNNKKNKGRTNVPKNTFKGPLVGYENHVYDISRNSGSDAFNTTTIKLSEYISRTITNAGEFLNAMNPIDLGFEDIPEPADPADNASQIVYEKWRTRYKNWDAKTTKRAEASKAAFAIIIGQCSDSLKDKMKTYDEWTDVQNDLGIVQLLQLIRTTMYSGTATNKSTLTYIEAELGLLNCKQSKKMSNSKYLETFRNRAEVYILFGGEPGTNALRVKAKLETQAHDPDNPTDDESFLATTQVREEYLAVLFIKNSDASKYGNRIMDLKVRYVEGNNDEGDPYPSTLAKALEMLETWYEAFTSTRRNTSTHDESGIAYLNANDNDADNHDSRNDGGRGRGGRGGGRGRNGARGRGRGGGRGRGRGFNQRNNGYQNDEAHNINDEQDQDNMGIFEQDDNDNNDDVNL